VWIPGLGDVAGHAAPKEVNITHLNNAIKIMGEQSRKASTPEAQEAINAHIGLLKGAREDLIRKAIPDRAEADALIKKIKDINKNYREAIVVTDISTINNLVSHIRKANDTQWAKSAEAVKGTVTNPGIELARDFNNMVAMVTKLSTPERMPSGANRAELQESLRSSSNLLKSIVIHGAQELVAKAIKNAPAGEGAAQRLIGKELNQYLSQRRESLELLFGEPFDDIIAKYFPVDKLVTLGKEIDSLADTLTPKGRGMVAGYDVVSGGVQQLTKVIENAGKNFESARDLIPIFKMLRKIDARMGVTTHSDNIKTVVKSNMRTEMFGEGLIDNKMHANVNVVIDYYSPVGKGRLLMNHTYGSDVVEEAAEHVLPIARRLKTLRDRAATPKDTKVLPAGTPQGYERAYRVIWGPLTRQSKFVTFMYGVSRDKYLTEYAKLLADPESLLKLVKHANAVDSMPRQVFRNTLTTIVGATMARGMMGYLDQEGSEGP
jgi:hypothetical protein